jgi:hypothetical protein
VEQIQKYILKNQGKSAEDSTIVQVQTSEPSTPEETAAALAAQEKKEVKVDEAEEPQTPEQTKAALAAMEAHKDPKVAIK